MAHTRQFKGLADHRVALIGALLLCELLALAVVYQFLVPFECRETDAYAACRFLRSMVARAMAVFAAGALLVLARRPAFARFVAAAREPARGARRALAVHLAGLALMAGPAIVALGYELSAFFALAAGFWVVGGVLAVVGAIVWMAPFAAWRRLAGDLGAAGPITLAVGLTIPDLANTVLPLWDLSWLTTATFALVHALLRMVSAQTDADAQAYIIGIEDFYVHIAPQCSGVEGLALVTGFTLLYALLFRDTIRFGRYWPVVLPLGLLLSWMLNVLRITALILIGAYVSPDLAVEGFHSHAGWLFFTLLAMAMLYLVHVTTWLHRAPAPPVAGPSLRADPIAAAIVPFVVFMLSGVASDALLAVPALGWPLRALVMAGALAYFWPAWRHLSWRPDPLALALGLAIGAGWLAVQPDGSATGGALARELAVLPTVALAVWIAARLVATIVLVPVVEELFFRGYLLRRLDRGGLAWRVAALVVTSGLFALLHGRWVEAAVAGLVFGLLMLRRGRVEDAIVSHVAANAVIGLAALAQGDWGLI